MKRIQALWNRGLVGKVIISLAGLVIVCCVIGILVPRRPQQQGAAPAAAPPATSGAAAAAQPTQPTEAPAATAGPTSPPPPSAMPAPTDTPEPTATPSPVPPTATPVPPVVIEGKGQTVTDPFTPPSSLNRVIFAHEGARNFIVTLYKPNGDTDIMVNEIGRYAGIRAMAGEGEGYYFEVKADGKWTIRVEPIGLEEGAAQGLDGSGDYASGLFMPTKVGPVPFTFKHTGKRNFIVILQCAGGGDYVQNEIGPVDGAAVVNFKKGPCFWDVKADGDWSIKPK